MIQSIKMLTAVLSISLLFSGCGTEKLNKEIDASYPQEAHTVNTISVENYMMTGENRLTFNSMPKNVVVAGLEETEMVLAFCPKESIKAVYGYYDLYGFVKPQYKKMLKDLNVLQRGQINPEYIITLQPDLIIAEQCSYTASGLRSTDFWNRRGIKTYVPKNTNNPSKHIREENLEDEYEYIEDFGKMFNNMDLAKSIVLDAKDTLAFFKNRIPNEEPQKVLIVEQFGKNIASYDKTKLGGKIVTELGGKIQETEPLISKEILRAIDPDVLFVVCSDGDHGKCLKNFVSLPVINKLKAVRNNRIYSIELETIYAPGLRIKDGIERIGLSLYPNLKEEYMKTQENTINPSYTSWLEDE